MSKKHLERSNNEKKINDKCHVEKAGTAEDGPRVPNKIQGGENVIGGEVQIDQNHQKRNGKGEDLKIQKIKNI